MNPIVRERRYAVRAARRIYGPHADGRKACVDRQRSRREGRGVSGPPYVRINHAGIAEAESSGRMKRERS